MVLNSKNAGNNLCRPYRACFTERCTAGALLCFGMSDKGLPACCRLCRELGERECGEGFLIRTNQHNKGDAAGRLQTKWAYMHTSFEGNYVTCA